jgi:trimeric autotransporter adhesin
MGGGVSEDQGQGTERLRADGAALPGVTPLSEGGSVAQAAPVAPRAQPADGAARPAAVADAQPPRAADPTWSTAFGATNVAPNPTAAAASGATLYLGGDFMFAMAGMPDLTYNRIARWDGVGWNRMGEGVDGPVHAIAVVGDDVFVGGEFTVAGGSVNSPRLARWDGTGWMAVAGGVHVHNGAEFATVRALASDGQRLFVAGTFDTVGTGANEVAANGFAILTLATGTWESPEGGLWFQAYAGTGRALLLSGRTVYVGGEFERAGSVDTYAFAALETTTGSWTGFGSGLRNGDFGGIVSSLALDRRSRTVFIGGTFSAADTVETSGVATLRRGRFGTLGRFERFGDPSLASVWALAFVGGKLHAGGDFTTAGDAAAENWAVHDGTRWSVPGDGVTGGSPYVLAPYRDGVVVAGGFTMSGERRITHAGVWSEAGWQTFGQGVSYSEYADGNVFALDVTDGKLTAGGVFDQAGPVRVGSVAEWRDDAWHDMAGGLGQLIVLPKVAGMLRVGGDLYVTGAFATAGGAAARNIARWDGETWSALGSGLNGPGYALVEHGGKVYVGGTFSTAGETAGNGVAAWDAATQAWSPLGNAPGFDHDVLSLAVVGDRYLVVGGHFHTLRAGMQDVARDLYGLVVFDTQAEIDPADPASGWLRMRGVQSSFGPGWVRALQPLGTDLYVGGTFDTAGVLAGVDPGFAAQNLAVWHLGTEDGRWSTPGGTDEPVQALTTLDGRSLVLGGWFGAAGPIAASGVVEHDPAAATWTAYGEGIGPGERGVRRVEALAQHADDGLWVGGTFNTAGGAPSCSIGLWRGTLGRSR